ncbi:MAG: class I SAM-dependent methyltransferase [Hyphomicrobiales bacterium]
MTSTQDLIAMLTAAAATAPRRENLWMSILQGIDARSILELGVWKGAFAERILRGCPSITHYFLLDAWQHLASWNKPWNVDQQAFDAVYTEAMERTDFARDRRHVLRGTTVEVIDQISDDSLDAAYVDGDHTLRGIAIDLIRTYPKVRRGGILGGDDYTPTIWQHGESYEPSLVFPFAVYFAESQRAPLVVLPHDQFAIVKPVETGNWHRVIDLTGMHGAPSLLSHVRPRA